MKKIIKPLEREEAVYYSDFSGKTLGEFGPDVELKITCNYGSKYDGTNITLHLDDTDLEKVIHLLKETISEDFKKEVRKRLDNNEKNLEDSIQMRDWSHCDLLSNNVWFLRKLLGFNDEEEV